MSITTELTLTQLLEPGRSIQDIKQTLRDHARFGKDINFEIVKEVFDKTEVVKGNYDILYYDLQGGMCRQIKNCNSRSSVAYLRALNHLAKTHTGLIGAWIDTNLLTILKAQLETAQEDKSIVRLNLALDLFRAYAQEENPAEFGREKTTTNGVRPIMVPGEMTYKIGSFGGRVTPFDYISGLRANKDLEIVETVNPHVN